MTRVADVWPSSEAAPAVSPAPPPGSRTEAQEARRPIGGQGDKRLGAPLDVAQMGAPQPTPGAGGRAAGRLGLRLPLALAAALAWTAGAWVPASAAAPAGASAPPPAQPAGRGAAQRPSPALEIAVGGGPVLPWAAASELGHAFFASVGVAWGPLRAAIAAGGVAPDSMARAAFPAVWAELTWEALGRLGPLAPYAIVGAGVALDDGLSDPRPGEVRWSRGGPQPLVMLGLGAAFRPGPRGMFLALDGRLFNLTHGGLTLGAGVRF